MPAVEHAVHFARSAPFRVNASQLVFYDVIEPDVMARSSVLSCVAEAGGEAKLPDFVTVSAFRKWLAAVTDRKADFEHRSFTCMCTVIQVADAIDDKQVDGWVHIAGERILDYVLSSNPEELVNGVLEGFALLPHHLQHRVLAVAAADPQLVDDLLAFLPTDLHASVLAAAVTPEKALRVPLNDSSLPALKALASLPASPPAVQSLHVDHSSYEGQAHTGRHHDVPEMCSSLIQALHHHTGLTSLLLQACPITSASHQLLLPALATLKSLQMLDLEGINAFSVESLPSLTRILHALPKLHHLRLLFTEDRVHTSQCRKRHRSDDDEQYCLADMLSPITALSSLSVRISQATDTFHRGCHSYFTMLKALKLPHLVQATAVFDDNISLAASFCTHLIAPLTSLHLVEGIQEPQWEPPSTPAVQQLLHSLAAFTQLRRFSAALPMAESDGSSILDIVTAALPALLAAFHQLECFTLSAAPTVIHRVVPQLPTAMRSLTELHLGSYIPAFHAAMATWPDFFQSLCQLQLQHLELYWNDVLGGPLDHGMAAMHRLTQLTALRVSGWACVDRPVDWRALAGMTRLQQLCLDDPGTLRMRPGCVASLRALAALTSLTLTTAEDDKQFVPGLVAQLPPQSLPKLLDLTVALYDPFDGAHAFAEYVTKLPALDQLTVHLSPSHVCGLDVTDEHQMRELVRDRDHVMACLTRATDSTAVALTFVTDEYAELGL